MWLSPDERGHRAELTDAGSGARLLTAASGKTSRLRDLEATLASVDDEGEA